MNSLNLEVRCQYKTKFTLINKCSISLLIIISIFWQQVISMQKESAGWQWTRLLTLAWARHKFSTPIKYHPSIIQIPSKYYPSITKVSSMYHPNVTQVNPNINCNVTPVHLLYPLSDAHLGKYQTTFYYQVDCLESY